MEDKSKSFSGLDIGLEQFRSSIDNFCLFLCSTFPESGVEIQIENIQEIASDFHTQFVDKLLDRICNEDYSIFDEELLFPHSNLDLSLLWHSDLTEEERGAIFLHLQEMCVWCPAPEGAKDDSVQSMVGEFFEGAKKRVLETVEKCPTTYGYKDRVKALFEEYIPEEKRTSLDVKVWLEMYSDEEIRSVMIEPLNKLVEEAKQFYETSEGLLEKKCIENCINNELQQAYDIVQQSKFWPLIKPKVASIIGDEKITLDLLKNKASQFFPNGFADKPDLSKLFNQHPMLKKIWKSTKKNEKGEPDYQNLQENMMNVLRTEFPSAFPPETVHSANKTSKDKEQTLASKKKSKTKNKSKNGRALDPQRASEIKKLLQKTS